MEDYDNYMILLKELYKKKSDWIERIKGIKFSLDSLQCIQNCYFYDKYFRKCDYCQSRSKISWILKRCLDQLIHATGRYFRAIEIMEPRESFCGLIQNFDDVIYMMEFVQFDIGQEAESEKAMMSNNDQTMMGFSMMNNVIQQTMIHLRNYHTTVADQIETLSL